MPLEELIAVLTPREEAVNVLHHGVTLVLVHLLDNSVDLRILDLSDGRHYAERVALEDLLVLDYQRRIGHNVHDISASTLAKKNIS